MRKPFTTIAAVIFGLMALVHLYRLFTHFQVIIGNHAVSEAASIVAFIVTGTLSIGLFRESRRSGRSDLPK